MLQVWAVGLIESLLVFVFCVYVNWRYAAKDRTPFYVYILSIFGWYLGFMFIFLIPLDIYFVKTEHVENEFLIICWSINYWTIFTFTWFVTPFFIEYINSSDFTVKEKVIRSIRNNVPVIILFIVFFVIVILILAFTSSGRDALKEDGVLGCVIGLNLVFGLLSIVLLLGYGLVKIPITFYKHSSNERKLKHYQMKVADYDNKLNTNVRKVQKLIQVAKSCQVEMEIQQYKLIILDDINKFIKQVQHEDIKIKQDSQIGFKVSKDFQGILNYNQIVRLRRRLRFLTTDIVRFISFKKENIESAIFIQDILDSQGRGDKVIRSYFVADRDQGNCCSGIILSLQYFWYVKAKPILMLILSIVFGCLSIIILYAEIANIFGAKYNIIFNIITEPEYDSQSSYYVANIICLIPLVYLVYAINFGMFQLKISNIYALHRNHRTDPSCLLFSSMFMMRLSVPIAYNFMEMTKLEHAALYHVMGSIQYVKFLGEGFNRWVFPICLFMMVFLTAFNIYGRIMNCLGLKQYSFEGETTKDIVDDGKFIIEQYKINRLQQLGNSRVSTQSLKAAENDNKLNFSGKIQDSVGRDTEGQPNMVFDKEPLLEDNNSMRESRASVASTLNLDNDSEYQARKGLRGMFNKPFWKKK